MFSAPGIISISSHHFKGLQPSGVFVYFIHLCTEGYCTTSQMLVPNASTLSSSYSSQSDKPPPMHRPQACRCQPSQSKQLPMKSSYLICQHGSEVTFLLFFSKRHREDVKMKACTQLHVINLLIPHACVYSSALGRTLSCWVWLKQRNLGKLGQIIHGLSSFKLVNDFKKYGKFFPT